MARLGIVSVFLVRSESEKYHKTTESSRKPEKLMNPPMGCDANIPPCTHGGLHSWRRVLQHGYTILHSRPTRLRNKTKKRELPRLLRKRNITKHPKNKVQNGTNTNKRIVLYHNHKRISHTNIHIHLNSKLKQKSSANLDVSQHPLLFPQIWPSLAVHHHAYQWKLAEPKTGDLRHGMTWLDTTGCLSMAAGPLRLARVLGLNARVGREH